jgi:hypothetical protein
MVFDYKGINMKTTIIENFLTEKELNEIERLFRSSDDLYIEKEKMGVRMSDTHLHSEVSDMRAIYWYPRNSTMLAIHDIINKKIKSTFGNDIGCHDWHILNAYRPYDLHSDSLDDDVPLTYIPENTEYAWTFLIPLGDYNTNTIVLNEESHDTKNFRKWVERTNPPIIDAIDDETYEKYFTHQNREDVRYVSIDTIFPWKKGTLLAMDRHRLHCSDNFYRKGIIEKRALVSWSIRAPL